MEKGFVRESLSPCVVLVILVYNIMVKIQGRIFFEEGGNDVNQSTKAIHVAP